MITNIVDQLKRDEGLRLKPYKDGMGKTTIGYGRNLDAVGVSEEEAASLLSNDVERTADTLAQALPAIDKLLMNDNVRWCVLVAMAFNMGTAGLLTFKNMLAAVQAGDWDLAADHMLEIGRAHV